MLPTPPNRIWYGGETTTRKANPYGFTAVRQDVFAKPAFVTLFDAIDKRVAAQALANRAIEAKPAQRGKLAIERAITNAVAIQDAAHGIGIKPAQPAQPVRVAKFLPFIQDEQTGVRRPCKLGTFHALLKYNPHCIEFRNAKNQRCLVVVVGESESTAFSATIARVKGNAKRTSKQVRIKGKLNPREKYHERNVKAHNPIIHRMRDDEGKEHLIRSCQLDHKRAQLKWEDPKAVGK